MAILRLRHLDNREIASTITGAVTSHIDERLNFIMDVICEEFRCGEDDVSFDETEDGDVILVDGKQVARLFVIYEPFAPNGRRRT